MTGGLLYMLTNQFADSICNLNFVQAAACTGDEESHLRLALARHLELTGSPRAEALLDSYRGLSFTRVQPVQLPCPVSQTWAPILERLKRFGESETIRSRVFESPVLASLTMRSNQPRNRPQRLREY
jgi:glutamate synthase domain-containing protein 3